MKYIEPSELSRAIFFLEKVIGILAYKVEGITESDQWPDARYPDNDPFFFKEDVEILTRAEEFIKNVRA